MEQAPAQHILRTQLEKRWLLPVRVLWLTALAIALGLFIAGLPLRASEIRSRYTGNIQASFLVNQAGEVIVSPWQGSASGRAGVLDGDILLSVDGVRITSPDQADALLEGALGTQVSVSVRTGRFPPRHLTITRESAAGEILLRYGLSSQFAVFFALSSEILFTLLCLGVAGVIFWYRSDDWMALFSAQMNTMILVGLSLPVLTFASTLNHTDYRIWVDIWFALSFEALTLFFYLFPTGRFASRFSLVLIVVLGLWLTLGLFNRSLLPWNFPHWSYLWTIAGWVATGMAALSYSYRRSNWAQRQQIRWIVWGASASAVGLMLQIIPQNFPLIGLVRVPYDFLLYPLGQLLKVCLPLAIAFAILRYRLWNIELIINRVLVYGSLSVLTMLGYLSTIFIMEALFTGLSNPVISFFATGFVAVLFEPLRQRLQRGVNHWMYGERDDPYAVLSRLVGTLKSTPSANDVLPAITENIGHSLKIPYVAIWLDEDVGEKMAASFGTETTDLVSFPLVYQGETIGRIEVAPRAPKEEFSDIDRRLLENIAQQAGAAAQTVRLNAELIQSRTQIVNEREEERLRIRRDLHDELGPMLAAQGLKLTAARQVIRSKPEKADELVKEVIEQSQQTVVDVRRLVHGLRPPALDQLGLVEAVRDLARSHGEGLTLDVLTSPDGLPPLPPAVEVNTYRIILEAWNNMVRHAEASCCIVRFLIEQNLLTIIIQDDGHGMPKDFRAGVGLRSMRARAEEIGGELRVDAVQPQGTRITARLPLSH